MMLHGLLVDLVPMSAEFRDRVMYEHWNNESRLWASMGDYGPISHATIKRIQEHRAEGRARGYNGVHFMMRARDGKIIGTMGINWFNYYSRYASLGAWIGEEDYWGGGHGTDGLLLLIEYAFNWYDLRRIDLQTMGLNERAQKNVEHVGFKLEARGREGTLVNGQWIDALTYGLLRDEWPGRETLVERLNLRARAEKRYGKID